MNWAVASEFITGSGGKLNPRGAVTRAQMAAILCRYMDDASTGDASKDNPRNSDSIGESELLVVSFGTSFNDNRAVTVGAIEEAMERAFPDYAVRRGFTSNIIIEHVYRRDGVAIDDVEQAGDIIDLLKYDEDTAGGLMGTEMLVVNENLSMPECIKELRAQAEEMDEIYYVYVVDNDYKLRGVLPLKKLITHPSVSKIKHVMEVDPASVKDDTPIDEVAHDFEKYDLVAMPVIDSIGRLVGHITVDDVMDRVRESSERDYQLASGLSQDVESDDTLWRQTKARLPWLLMGIVGGIGNSLILGNFEQGFVTNPAMALFIPMIGGTGGNVGIQSSAIVVQGLANGSLDLKESGRQILKEVGVGFINGLIISLLVFIYNAFQLAPWNPTTLAVSLSLMAVVLFASIFGTFVPLTLERFKIDPALATGPFISITNDIIGMMIYMLISSWLMSVLV